jgi:hypothetical protein
MPEMYVRLPWPRTRPGVSGDLEGRTSSSAMIAHSLWISLWRDLRWATLLWADIVVVAGWQVTKWRGRVARRELARRKVNEVVVTDLDTVHHTRHPRGGSNFAQPLPSDTQTTMPSCATTLLKPLSQFSQPGETDA